MKCLYERMIEEKDQELRDQKDRAERRDQMKEVRIRELQQELRAAREAAAVTEAPSHLAETTIVEAAQAASNTRRRLSYSADFSAPLFATQEEPAGPCFSLQLDASQVGTLPSAPPSAGAMGNDTRRRLSYTVGTQTPDTPAFDPFSEMAQRLFDSQLEAANSTIIGSTPGASGFPVAVAEPIALEELSMTQDASLAAPHIPAMQLALPDVVDAVPAAPPIPAMHLALPDVAEESMEATASLVDQATTPTVPAPSPGPAFQSATPPLPRSTPAAVAAKAVATQGLAATKLTSKTTVRPKASASSSIQRALSERPRHAADSPRSPMSFSPRRSESARFARPAQSATPPRVQKESPPRGCVKEKVNLFEQKCNTPRGPSGGNATSSTQSIQHRSSGAGLPEALRRGPHGVSIPTPGSAGARR
jgi:hypothetical protein